MNEFVSRIDERKYLIKFSDNTHLLINEKEYEYSIRKISSDNYILILNNKSYHCFITDIKNSSFELLINGQLKNVISNTLISDKAEELLNAQNKSQSSAMIVKAPMPGLILKIKKQNGDYVERGETVMILEAMKMENEIRAPLSGHLTLNSVQEGRSVEKDTILFEIV